MKKNVSIAAGLALVGALAFGGVTMRAEDSVNVGQACKDLPSWSALRTALSNATLPLSSATNGGLALNMWGTIVNRDGVVCAVAFTGSNRGDQWPGSRVISAQKANTANAFSLTGLSLSTANLYTPTQPGGSLFGLQESNPVATDVAYGGNPVQYGTAADPMVGFRIGGVNVFGGGLALYNSVGKLVGAVGVSGDTSCADHNIAYKTRANLQLDYVPAGVAQLFAGDGDHKDNIIYDITPQPEQMPGVSATGFGHPTCGGTEPSITLPNNRVVQ